MTYAKLLGEKIAKHKVDVWLVNTGWSGGPYGEGKRMELALTRAMVSAVLSGLLKDTKTEIDPIFGVGIPLNCPGVPDGVLNPRKTWKNPDAYDKKASQLAKMFNENFKEYEKEASNEVKAANPRI
jgi:phosphoenolpyruvate carboxykinase (ATP)